MCEKTLPCSTSTEVHRSVLGMKKSAATNNERENLSREVVSSDPTKCSEDGTGEALA